MLKYNKKAPAKKICHVTPPKRALIEPYSSPADTPILAPKGVVADGYQTIAPSPSETRWSGHGGCDLGDRGDRNGVESVSSKAMASKLHSIFSTLLLLFTLSALTNVFLIINDMAPSLNLVPPHKNIIVFLAPTVHLVHQAFINDYDYVFAENGLVAHKDGKLIGTQVLAGAQVRTGGHREWKLCSGMDENVVGTCAEVIFAPIDASFADDAPLLPPEASSPNRTLDLASALEIGPAGNKESNDCAGISGSTRSVMTIAFEFVFENHMQENVASMARQYVRSIISSVQRVALALSPSHPNSHGGLRLPLGTPEANTLSQWIATILVCHEVLFFRHRTL
ncbi:Homeobox-leucine zipper protein ATHB-15 [Camellia lanceoleosa]|uniref:Homeobox-leucine zipper protein ATHB-15 n=1 Tax=Camellia lanceoleosa TaxID=1840588 RepID=A0ACC0IYK7_9ERIC|nr:Homeobox-leucine zipper protein ATHB-15 [Camellia lanceoleosa]